MASNNSRVEVRIVFDEIGGGSNPSSRAQSCRDASLRHSLGGVVGAFCVDIRAQFFQKRFDVGFGEEHDVIHAAKRGD